LDIARDSGDAAIVETVIAMAHGLDLMVVAEGVETAEQLDFLRVRDCHIMQGYYFARPMPAEEFIEYLSLECPVAAVAAQPCPAASPLNGA
jgi:FOG: EAL domain